MSLPVFPSLSSLIK
jgi:vacuolar protein sorting-associated protein 45